MSADATPPHPPAPVPPQPAAPPNWDPLSVLERRVLGVLVEKQKTSKTADSYPLTLNALTTGCNQKSNRDPVLELTDDEVEEGLSVLQKKGLVMRLTGGRVDRFKHLLYETWTRNGPQLAVIAELLLRGPQTKGELRGRAGRMDPIDTLDALEDVLKPLVERRLAVYLTEPDRRGAIISHGFHTPDELPRLKTHHASALAEADVGPARPGAASAVAPDALAAVERRLTDAIEEIGRLRTAVTALEGQVGDLRKQLGLTPG
ncbi:MAG: hypothetical protein JWO38_6389 [Gemmataceae bacterium]|nr:hypothetical protein [Gemmataceae bacterium]